MVNRTARFDLIIDELGDVEEPQIEPVTKPQMVTMVAEVQTVTRATEETTTHYDPGGRTFCCMVPSSKPSAISVEKPGKIP